MRFAPLVAAAALVLPTALAGTCPNNPLAHCYPTACQGTTAVDIVFVIDMSASMSDYIKGTVNALNGFVSNINGNAALDAKYGIYTFGFANSLGSKAALPNPQPAQYTALQTGAAVQTSLNALVSQTSGSIENGLVAVTKAANEYAWRSGSVKNIFLLTNEDSDPDFALKSSEFDAYYYPSTYNALPSAHPWADWQAEIDTAATAVIAKNISVYMSVLTYNDLGSNGGLLTPLQYGEPSSSVQSQNSTFGDFSAATTLNNIKARYFTKSCSKNCVSTTSTGVSIANSLQAQVLASQIRGNALTARVFDLSQVTSNSKFFNNIFSALQSNIDGCSACYQYSCAADGVTCGTPKYICDCAGKPLGTSTIDCAGVCGGTSQIDVCTGVCSKTANLNPAKCTCPSLTYDPCGNCNTAAGWNTTSTQFCIQNCKGQWVNATDLNTFNDDCGVKCGNNNAKDLCGVCFGNNTKVVYANDGPCACFVNPVTCPGSGYTMCHIPDSARLPDGSINTTAICPVITGCDLTANNYVCGQCYSKTTDNSTIYDNCGYCKNLNATCVQDCKGVYGGGAKTDQCGNCQEPGVVDPNCVLDCTGNYTTNVTVALDCNYKCVSLSQVSKANCTTVIAIPPTSNPPNNTPAIVGGVVGGLAAVAAVAGLLFYLHRSGVLGAASKQVDMGASSQNPLYSSATQVQSNPLYAS